MAKSNWRIYWRDVLPPELFKCNTVFSGGEAVDAIVRAGEYIIPVDAKFSLDNYNKMVESSDAAEITVLEKRFKEDIKSRIDETAKYIRPTEENNGLRLYVYSCRWFVPRFIEQ